MSAHPVLRAVPLACALILLAPVASTVAGLPFGQAVAKDGGSGHGGSGGGDSGGSGSGSSSSGGDSSGPGSGGSDDSGDNSGKGKGGGDGDDDGMDRGRSRSVDRYFKVLESRGRIVEKRRSGSTTELKYSDGWREVLTETRYRLYNSANRRVIDRPARTDDFARLRAAGN